LVSRSHSGERARAREGKTQYPLNLFIIFCFSKSGVKPKWWGEDPDDDVVLGTAYDGKAKFIVSGDKHLLSLKGFRKIKIVTVAQVLDVL